MDELLRKDDLVQARSDLEKMIQGISQQFISAVMRELTVVYLAVFGAITLYAGALIWLLNRPSISRWWQLGLWMLAEGTLYLFGRYRRWRFDRRGARDQRDAQAQTEKRLLLSREERRASETAHPAWRRKRGA